MREKPEWIAVDCDATRLRAWAMGAAGILADARSDLPSAPGPSASGGQSRFEAALLALIEGWLVPGHRTPVIACGPSGAGPTPLRAIPCPPLGAPVPVTTSDGRIDLRLVPGLSQRQPVAALIRGDETRLAGVLAARPGWDGVVCLPGAQTCWAELSAGEVISLHTALSGTLFDLLARRMMPGQAVGTADAGRLDHAAFDTALGDILARPQSLAGQMARVEAAFLLDGDGAESSARLAGVLVGADLASARPWWLGREIVIVGDGPLATLYSRALKSLGVEIETIRAMEVTLAGLNAARLLPAT